MRGSLITRIGDGIKDLIGLPIRRKIPRKIIYERNDLSENIERLSSELKQDEAKMKAYEAYQIAYQGAESSMGIKELDWSAPLIREEGILRATFPIETVTVDILKKNLAKNKSRTDREVEELASKNASVSTKRILFEVFIASNSSLF